MNEAKLILLHTLTPLHVGTGQAVANVDLPIAREKATGFPIIPASAFKGVLRDYFKFCAKWEEDKLVKAFGSEPPRSSEEGATPQPESQPEASNGGIEPGTGDTPATQSERQPEAGDWAFTDLRILCLPVRSFYGTFAYVTCPLVLQRLTQVAKRLNINIEIELGEIPLPNDTEIALADGTALSRNGCIYLEELDLTKSQQDATSVAKKIANMLFGNDRDGASLFRARFAIVSDQAFSYFSETATEVSARVRLHEDKKTVATGALWYEECAPAESIFYGFATHVKPPELRLPFEDNLAGELLVQVGGDATIGRGISRVVIG